MYKTTFSQVKIIVLAASALLMILISVYLTNHYFEVRFPEGLSGGSICNINDFFNCDKISNSPLAAPFKVPLSIFGGLLGLLVAAGCLVKKESFQQTLFSIFALNFVGCLVLLFYSLFVLKGLCLFCSFYYILSAIVFYIYFKQNIKFSFSMKPIALIVIISLALALFVRHFVLLKVAEVENADSLLIESVMSEYKQLPQVSFVDSASDYKLNRVANAPIQMVIFSDFECPACKVLSEQIPEILKDYKEKINISYYFYPLDQSCNPNVNRAMHQHACKAAAASICMPTDNFYNLHDLFFNNQNSFSEGFVEKFIAEQKIESCTTSLETKNKLLEIIKAADPVQISSTPTFLINGVKFEGALPYYKLKIIIDSLLK